MRLGSSDQKLQNKKPQQQKSVTDCVAGLSLCSMWEKRIGRFLPDHATLT